MKVIGIFTCQKCEKIISIEETFIMEEFAKKLKAKEGGKITFLIDCNECKEN